MRRLLVTIACAAVLAAIAATPALAADAAGSGTATVRVVHLSPDAPGVDVYVDGQRILGNLTFHTASDYQTVPAGKHTVELRPGGADPSTKPVLSATPTLVAGQAYTVAGLGPVAKLRGEIFTDDLTAPPPGEAKVRVIHADNSAKAVDAQLVNGPTLARGLAFASATPYVALAPGNYALRATNPKSGAELVNAPAIAVGSGTVYTIALTGGSTEQLQVVVLVDARGAEVLPAEALRTGAGGTAEPPGDARWPLVVAGLAFLGLAGIGVRRRFA